MQHLVKAVHLPRKRKNEPTARQRRQEHARAWKAFLKDDVDWDYSAIVRMLIFKLERTRRCIVGNGIIADAPEVAQQIEQVVGLLKRVEADDYMDEISREHKKKYGTLKMIAGKGDGRSVPIKMVFRKLDNKRAHDEHSRLYQLADQMRRDDLATAMMLMAEHLLGWWD